MIIKYNNKKIQIPAKRIFSLGKMFGLMFKTKNTGNLLFDFDKKTRTPIHSVFVFFKFLAIWLDEKNNVLELKVIRPFTPKIAPKKQFSRLIEVPFNNKNKRILNFFVDKK